MKTFWEVWKEEIPNKDKPLIVSHFMKKWQLTKNPTILRLKASSFKFLMSDLKDINDMLSIAYSLEKGFFVDYRHKAEKEIKQESKSINLYGLS